jgi:Cu2+-exporting ATPase
LVLFAARRRIRTAVRLGRQGRVGVETLSSVSISGAMIGQYFFLGSLLGFTSALGDLLASRVIDDSHHQLVDLYKGIPNRVWLLSNGVETAIPFNEVCDGDVLVVSAGEIIPADGCIVDGVAGIDEHRFTGESLPVEKGIGDQVFAVTLVLSGRISFRVERAGAETSAMKIADILNRTADYKSITVLESQALSRQLVKPALLVGAISWPLFGYSAALGMVIAHPKERLQVSAPISLMRYLKAAMAHGVLIKDGRSIELLHQVDTVVFDKTGTLTEDRPQLGSIHRFAEVSENEILRLAAIAEHKQSHPLAHALRVEAERRQLALVTPEHSSYRLGYGVKAISNGRTIRVGSQRFLQAEGLRDLDQLQAIAENCRYQGHGFVAVSLDQQLLGVIELLPTLRPEAGAVIAALKRHKRIKQIYILSGDHDAPTRRLAEQLGIDRYFAQTLPEEKAAVIEQLQRDGAFVCFIGDGINDAIAMKQAQVSISLSGATQLAMDTAQILLLDRGIGHLTYLFSMAGNFNTHMRQQMAMILGPSLFGVTMICLAGWGTPAMMMLNILGLGATISYSLFGGRSFTSASPAQPTVIPDQPSVNIRSHHELVHSAQNKLSQPRFVHQRRRAVSRLRRASFRSKLLSVMLERKRN